MSKLIVREIEDGDEDDLIALWQACDLTRPWNDPAADLAFARGKPSSQILVGLAPNQPDTVPPDGTEVAAPLIASAMVGHDGHRGNMYYVAVHPDHRGNSHGRTIMDAGERWLARKGVWAIRLMIRTANKPVLDFYSKLGYQLSDVVIMGKRIEPDERF